MKIQCKICEFSKICKFSLEMDSNIGFEFCPKCGCSLKEENDQVLSQKDNWMEIIYNDENMWWSEGFDRLPSVIAFEYSRLKEMFNDGQSYGVYFEIKDLYETVLKYVVLIACAWGCKTDIPNFKEKIACQISTPNMSMGSWYALGNEILKFIKRNEKSDTEEMISLPKEIIASLEVISSEYGNNSSFSEKKSEKYENQYKINIPSVINWRNEKIGHGALGFEEDEQFRGDIIMMVERIKDLFEFSCGENETLGGMLSKLQLFIGDKQLVGSTLIDKNESDNELSIKITDRSISVYPYFIVSEGFVFFFDNQPNEKLTQILSYNNGKRDKRYLPYFSGLYNEWKKLKINYQKDISDEKRIKAEDELINKLGIEPNYVAQKHLVNWLSKAIEKNNSGTFYLKMPRGSGKSTFAEHINKLNEGKGDASLKDIDIRTYHITRTQIVNLRDFERQIEEQWRHDFENQTEWTGYKQIKEFRDEGCSPSEALVMFMKECRDFTKELRGKDKVLLVLDGLDEINDDDLWDYVSDISNLPDDVYILLTSRDPDVEKLPYDVSKKLRSIKSTEERKIDLTEEENIQFLKEFLMDQRYIKPKVRKSLETDAIEIVMKKAEYRVLYFGMMCRLLDSGISVDKLPEPGYVEKSYIRELEKRYGEKEMNRMNELITVLCWIGEREPISIREIASLINNGKVTIELLSMLNDLFPLLRIQRGYMINGKLYVGENRFEFANYGLRDSVLELIGESKTIINSIIKSAYDDVRYSDNISLYSEKNSIPLLVFASISASNFKYIKGLFGTEKMNGIISIVEYARLQTLSKMILMVSRAQKCHKNMNELYEDLSKSFQISGEINDFKIKNQLIYTLLMCEEFDEAEDYCDDIYRLAQGYKDRLSNNYEKDIISYTYELIGRVYRKQKKNDYVEGWLVQAQKTRESIQKSDENDVKLGYINNLLACFYYSVNRVKDAAELIENTLKTIKNVKIDDAAVVKLKAVLFVNLGIINISRGETKEGFKNVNEGKSIVEAYDNTDISMMLETIVGIYNTISGLYIRDKQYQDALEYGLKVKGILDDLDHKGYIFEKITYSNILINIADALFGLKKYCEALQYYEEEKGISIELYKNRKISKDVKQRRYERMEKIKDALKDTNEIDESFDGGDIDYAIEDIQLIDISSIFQMKNDENVQTDESEEDGRIIERTVVNKVVEGSRRTMVLFFVVDTSGSMGGSKIDVVNSAIKEIVPELKDISESNAYTQIKVATLAFSTGAQWMDSAPVAAEDFRWNDLDAGGVTDLGEACIQLNEKMSRNAFMSDATGSVAPAIFLMTDGIPSDDYQYGLEKLKQNNWFKKAIKVAVAIGDYADENVLADFTGNVEAVITVHTPDTLKKWIQFVSVRASEIGSKSSNAGSSDSSSSSGSGELEIVSKQDEFIEEIQAQAGASDWDSFDDNGIQW